MNTKSYIINSNKAAQIWGGVHIGYTVNEEEIKSVEDKVYGDMLIEVWAHEISDVHKLDMCVNSKMSCRKSARCIGSHCNFCGKFGNF